MAAFKDETGHEWRVRLDAISLEEIKQDHSIDLVDLDKDPLRRVINDGRILAAIMCTLCRDQIAAKGITLDDFVKVQPQPPDTMLDALRDALISFFHSGRASHIREVLSKFDQMAGKTDELAAAKIQQVMDDPKVMQGLTAKADRVINQEIEKILQSAGTT